MRSFLLFLLAPVAVLCTDYNYSTVTTGDLCCDKGIEDPNGFCKGMNLNAYGCCDVPNRPEDPNSPNAKFNIGCDGLPDDFPVGRTVVASVPGSVVKKFVRPGDNMIGFVGCAA
ncbi:hypothetical protein LZ30DRAFT_729726 [Colletotrichum cereale]|nr:hypothetical protein LZ30DRAFT_729726 [Colletotrichum cereale]